MDQTLLAALELVYGTCATKDEYPTATVLAVMNKLLGRVDPRITEAELIEVLNGLHWARPRPGKPGSRHPLLWRFSNANGTGATPTKKRRQPARPSKSIAESQRLTR